MAFFIWGEYKIDLGWYGGLNRNGFYEVTLMKGNKIIESSCSQDIEKVTEILNYFFYHPFK